LFLKLKYPKEKSSKLKEPKTKELKMLSKENNPIQKKPKRLSKN
jgi:hypothetical protein